MRVGIYLLIPPRRRLVWAGRTWLAGREHGAATGRLLRAAIPAAAAPRIMRVGTGSAYKPIATGTRQMAPISRRIGRRDSHSTGWGTATAVKAARSSS